MITAGIDIGSRNTKLVIWDSARSRILFSKYCSTDAAPLLSLRSLWEAAYSSLGITPSDVSRRIATGYGRNLVADADKVLSEISCHAAGVRHYHPACRTVIDIGGQDSKIIVMDARGKVVDFAMNDKCAAGTGRFLEMTAMRLGCDLDGLADLAARAAQSMELNSTCVVFAETEIISLMSQSIPAEEISMAVHRSIARRIHSQSGAVEVVSPVAFTGGVAMNRSIASCLAELFDTRFLELPDPEITGALGAAILGSA